MNLAETCHFINLIPPLSDSNGEVSSTWSMEEWSHVTIIVQFGATDADAGTITIQKCEDLSSTGPVDFAFEYYAEETDAGDVLSATPTRAVAAAGIDCAPAGVNNIFYVIEIDAAELGQSYPCLRLTYTTPNGATLISALAILSGGRDARAGSPTVLS